MQQGTKTSNKRSVRLDVLDSKSEVRYSGEYTKEKIVIGRVLSADLRIDDPAVSRIHALIEVRDGHMTVTDLASTHGTKVNGKKVVDSGLKFGDEITLGTTVIRVLAGEGEARAAAIPGTQISSDSEATLVNIDRKLIEKLDRRDSDERRKQDVFPDEQRLTDRRSGDRRINQRASGSGAGLESSEDRRTPRDWERRIGDRRKNDRRVFDITSLERRIEDRRTRKGGDDDVLPAELEAAFKEPEHAREMEVTVLWGDHILDVSNYADPIILTVGESYKSSYVIPSVGIPDEFPLLTIEEDGTALLAFTDSMKGTVRARDKIYKLSELKEEKFVRQISGYYVVPLANDDFAKVSIGNIGFFALFVKPAQRIGPAPFFDRDKLYLKTLIGSFLLMLLMITGLSFIPEPKPVTIEMIPERFAKVIIRKKPKIPDADVVKPKAETQEKGSKSAEGSKAKQPESKAAVPEKKPEEQIAKKPQKKETVKAVQPTAPQRKVVDKQKAKSVGILKALGGSTTNIKNLLDSDPGLDAFNKSAGAFKGSGATGVGKVVKGVDVGGGGETVGIDGPSTKGIGGGAAGEGIGEGISGPGRLGQKGEHTVSIVSENVQVLSGLPKDVINAVVNRHAGEIRQCYEAARQRNPSLRGKVVIKFNIEPTGRVSYAGIASSTVGDDGLHSCMLSRVRSWQFPQPEAPVVTQVSAFPFFLNPGN